MFLDPLRRFTHRRRLWSRKKCARGGARRTDLCYLKATSYQGRLELPSWRRLGCVLKALNWVLSQSGPRRLNFSHTCALLLPTCSGARCISQLSPACMLRINRVFRLSSNFSLGHLVWYSCDHLLALDALTRDIEWSPETSTNNFFTQIRRLRWI